MLSLGTSNQKRYHQHFRPQMYLLLLAYVGERAVCYTSTTREISKVVWEITHLDIDVHMAASIPLLLHGVLSIKPHLPAASCC